MSCTHQYSDGTSALDITFYGTVEGAMKTGKGSIHDISTYARGGHCGLCREDFSAEQLALMTDLFHSDWEIDGGVVEYITQHLAPARSLNRRALERYLAAEALAQEIFNP